MEFDADVAIVGYGPVGQAMAIGLAELGHSVLVLERWPSLYPLPRAIVYDHEIARIFQSLDVADALAPHTALSSSYEWRNAQGEPLKVFNGLDKLGISGWPQRLGFSQPYLERTLDKRARSFGDQISILQGWQVTALEQVEDGVVLEATETKDPTSPPKRYLLKYIVGCDGAGSFVRRAMGSEYEDLGFSSDWLVVDVLPVDPERWTNELIQICDPARPTTNVSGGPGRRRFEFMLLEGESKDDMNSESTAWKLLAPYGWTPQSAVLERHAVYTFRGCVATQWRNDRIMIAGDAAHLTPPFAGQGLCAGIRDVASLTWRLDLLLKERVHSDILDAYGTERSYHVRQFIEFAIELGKVICVLDPVTAAKRDAWLLGEGAHDEDRFPNPRLPPSDCLRYGDPLAGQLSLQARVRVGEQVGRFDDLVGGGFVLLSLNSHSMKELSPSQRAFMLFAGVQSVSMEQGGPVEDVDGSYREWFSTLGCEAVLIRPDFYIFGGGAPAELVNEFASAGYWIRPHVLDSDSK
ncbi:MULTISPECIES: bifunctional 3-(3-hydroxy-phenyl)propionate/3-hydroxycinnamic acid hydroxylase [Burkholderia]|uniref:bifunctional 3-(3-hydroxy-phenyl)propionate/3-hydroxycinnamic acid hydroxylase MhpA n=1 Tax=Burkholderia TaxID=32008 RepID=UPI00078D1224|nr:MULTISPECIES: bifunctional 3-(3-hydroxy-phenyl)propionate/3-hydroxycinnamic acid hydroxylase [Burkholderia]AMU04676.1 monooxygenase [Burkholderia cenocepacia]RQS24177.1 bifunctional 3-(3-hydroxy-phenyl)propionate/3-hydroxycinnamic acid hydroxylase [Burkholderia sp. Bp8995]RQS38906.1 bifunctional 3-(3-hydroxy-phenyl)propionate/3-hydroxycinnamic acid hydroxylase [Burkholderia sp. Bp8989]